VGTAGSAGNDAGLSAEGSASMLGALSAAVTPAEEGDANAAEAQTVATGVGTDGYCCSPRHRHAFEPSLLELCAIL